MQERKTQSGKSNKGKIQGIQQVIRRTPKKEKAAC
jgi:hypothetical protein